MFTIICELVRVDRSVRTTNLSAKSNLIPRDSCICSAQREDMRSRLIGIDRPDLPLEAESVRFMQSHKLPSASMSIDHFRFAISFARRPALTERRNIV